MQERKLTCINCPKGCHLSIQLDGKQVIDVSGYSCEQGKKYAIQETIEPRRMLTSTIKINHGTHRVLPVITSKEIRFEQIQDAMKQLSSITIDAPIKAGDIIVENFMEEGIHLISERNMDRIDA